MIDPYQAAEWAISALIALGISLVALRLFKLAPTWALVIGMVVFTGLQFPIQTHAVKLDFPPPRSN